MLDNIHKLEFYTQVNKTYYLRATKVIFVTKGEIDNNPLGTYNKEPKLNH